MFWKFLRKFHGDHFHIWQFPWCAAFFSDVLEAQGKLVCLQILDVGSRIRWHVFSIRSHVFTMSRPQQLLEVHGHPTQRLMLSLRMWDTTSAATKNRLFCRLFFFRRVSLNFRLQLESLLYLLCCGALRMMLFVVCCARCHPSRAECLMNHSSFTGLSFSDLEFSESFLPTST